MVDHFRCWWCDRLRCCCLFDAACCLWFWQSALFLAGVCFPAHSSLGRDILAPYLRVGNPVLGTALDYGTRSFTVVCIFTVVSVLNLLKGSPYFQTQRGRSIHQRQKEPLWNSMIIDELSGNAETLCAIERKANRCWDERRGDTCHQDSSRELNSMWMLSSLEGWSHDFMHWNQVILR